MIKVLDVKVVNGVPTVEDVSLTTEEWSHLIVWHLVGTHGWFEKLDFDHAHPPRNGIFGKFHPVARAPWAVMTDSHARHDTDGTWPYALTVNLGGKKVLVCGSGSGHGGGSGSGGNPNIKNN